MQVRQTAPPLPGPSCAHRYKGLQCVSLWRIYYADGAMYSTEDGSPFDAPALGVQAIAQEDREVGRTLLSRHEFYWWTGSEWFGGDIFGLWDYLASPGPKRVAFGRSMTTPEYQAIMRKATDDPYLPRKSAKDALGR